MGFFADFKKFATKGNLIDVAIGFLMGTTFTKLVGSFTSGLVAPILGLLTGGQDFDSMEYVVKEPVLDAAGKVVKEGVSFKYGIFITSVIDFLIIVLVCFLFIKMVLRKDPIAKSEPTPTEALLTEIRDELKKK